MAVFHVSFLKMEYEKFIWNSLFKAALCLEMEQNTLTSNRSVLHCSIGLIKSQIQF